MARIILSIEPPIPAMMKALRDARRDIDDRLFEADSPEAFQTLVGQLADATAYRDRIILISCQKGEARRPMIYRHKKRLPERLSRFRMSAY